MEVCVHSVYRSGGPRRSCVVSEPSPHLTAEAKPGRAVQGMSMLKEATLFALGTGMQEQPAQL